MLAFHIYCAWRYQKIMSVELEHDQASLNQENVNLSWFMWLV